MPPKTNTKAQAALEKKAAAQSVKDASERKKKEAQEVKEWKMGANNRGASRAESAAEKADEALRKKKEKEALLAAEEEELGNTKIKKNVGAGMNAKKAKGKKKQDDFSLLEDSLVSAADKKSKAAKKAAQLKKEREAKVALQKKPQSTTNNDEDPYLGNTEEMLRGAATCVGGSGEIVVGSKANKAIGAGDVAVSGLSAALAQISIGTMQQVNQADIHPEKRSKALHMAFQERRMPEMKKDYPGLKKSQYQEKLFKLWLKSPENPTNWPRTATTSLSKK